MCELMTAAIAMVAGDLAELQMMILLTTAVGHMAREATSTGCRRALDPDCPQRPLARLDGVILPSPTPCKLSRTFTCALRKRSRSQSWHRL